MVHYCMRMWVVPEVVHYVAVGPHRTMGIPRLRRSREGHGGAHYRDLLSNETQCLKRTMGSSLLRRPGEDHGGAHGRNLISN